MKAAVYYETGAPEVLRYEDVPDPELNPGGVLVEVAAISIEGGDTLNRLGSGDGTVNAEAAGYMLRGFFESIRRHIAFEQQFMLRGAGHAS